MPRLVHGGRNSYVVKIGGKIRRIEARIDARSKTSRVDVE
jgi:hypothetical protein